MKVEAADPAAPAMMGLVGSSVLTLSVQNNACSSLAQSESAITESATPEEHASSGRTPGGKYHSLHTWGSCLRYSAWIILQSLALHSDVTLNLVQLS